MMNIRSNARRGGNLLLPLSITGSMYVCIYVCMYGCMDGWMDGWMDGLMEG